MKTKINSIGLKKPEYDGCCGYVRRVNSSTVAAMMKEDGYNVIGITLKLYDGLNRHLSLNNVVLVKIYWMPKELLTS